MPENSTVRKSRSTQPKPPLQSVAPETNPYNVAMRRLGLDWHSIDIIADEYRSNGEDDHLVLTIILLRRLLKLVDMREIAPESVDNYLSMLIDRLYRATEHCAGEAGRFAAEADHVLQAKSRPALVSERSAS